MTTSPAEPGPFAMTLAAIFERLSRLEDAAGITESTAAEVELRAMFEADPDG